MENYHHIHSVYVPIAMHVNQTHITRSFPT